MDLLKVINSHRSIRSFKTQKIEEHLFQQIIMAGQSSASSSFIQACTIIRIKDKEKRKALREIAGGGRPMLKKRLNFGLLCGFEQTLSMLREPR